jgi:hypothetical protein
LTVAVGDPLPGNRNDCQAFTDSGVDQQCAGAAVMADGGYQGNPTVIMPYRNPRAAEPPLPQWKQDLNTVLRCPEFLGQGSNKMVPETETRKR